MGPLIVSPTLRYSPYLAGLGIGAEDATQVVTLTVDILPIGRGRACGANEQEEEEEQEQEQEQGGCGEDDEEDEARVIVHCDVLRQLGCYAGDIVVVRTLLIRIL